MAPTQRFEPLFAGFVAFHFVAVLTTCVRLGHRYRRRQLWWDDFWAFLSLITECFIIINYISLGVRRRDTYSVRVQEFFTWMSYLSSPTTLWAARIAIMAAIVRLLPSGRNRIITQITYVIFGMMGASVLLSKTFMCGVPVPRQLVCNVPFWTTILSLTVNLIAASWLVGWPIFLLSRMKLPKHERNLIIACFASGACLVPLDIGHAFNLIRAKRINDQMRHWQAQNVTGNLQVIMSVLCCNSLVLVTFIYRIWRRSEKKDPTVATEESSSEEDRTTTNRGASQRTDTTRTQHPTTNTDTTGVYSTINHFTSINTGEGYLTSDKSYELSGNSTENKAVPVIQIRIDDSSHDPGSSKEKEK